MTFERRVLIAIIVAFACGAILAGEAWASVGTSALAMVAASGGTAIVSGAAAWKFDWPAPAPVAIVPTGILFAIIVLAGTRGIGVEVPADMLRMYLAERVLVALWVGGLIGVYGGARRFDSFGK